MHAFSLSYLTSIITISLCFLHLGTRAKLGLQRGKLLNRLPSPKDLFKHKPLKSCTDMRYQHYDEPSMSQQLPEAHIPLHKHSPNLPESKQASCSGSVHSAAKGKQEGMLTTHLLATNLAAKCNQLVSPGSLCSQGRESKAPAEGHSVHPN